MENIKNNWISVNEFLPKAGGIYLVTICGQYVKNRLVKFSYFSNGKFDIENVIAWMNMPLPYIF